MISPWGIPFAEESIFWFNAELNTNSSRTMNPKPFTISIHVRDYECDIQGIVNNAVYQNYLEHCRHEFLKSHNYDFATLCQQGINLVISRAEIDYRKPLRSGDKFNVTLTPTLLSKFRLQFEQKIIHSETQTIMLEAIITVVSIDQQGKPFASPILEELCDEI